MNTLSRMPLARHAAVMLPVLVLLAASVAGCPEEMPDTGNGGVECTSHEDCNPPQTYCFGGECSAG